MDKNYKFLALDKLVSVGECSLEMLLGIFDITDAMMSTYPEAYRKLKRSRLHPSIQLLDRDKLALRINLSKMLSKLKKEGVVANKKKGWWLLTKKGEKKFKLLSEKYQLRMWKEKILEQKSKQKINKNKQILVIFDIPESKKSRREWLRVILRSLDFKPLQKSVWIGNAILPEEFVEALTELKLLSFVEIFSIAEEGTINIPR